MENKQNHNIFISWSGERSRQIGVLLRDWLPTIIPSATPWMSSEDISKGGAWATDIRKKLQQCTIGILVITPDNKDKPWVLFEAGALEKTEDTALRCVLLDGIDPPLAGPLGQFQATIINSSDIKKLCLDIHNKIANNLDTSRSEKIFDKFWPDFIDAYGKIKENTLTQDHQDQQPKEIDLIRDILNTVRTIEKKQQILFEYYDKNQPVFSIRNQMDRYSRYPSFSRTPIYWPQYQGLRKSDPDFVINSNDIEVCFYYTDNVQDVSRDDLMRVVKYLTSELENVDDLRKNLAKKFREKILVNEHIFNFQFVELDCSSCDGRPVRVDVDVARVV